MSRKLQMFIKILIAATFFVPLIVVPSSYIFPFIVPKIIWFRSLSLLILGGYILLLASNWREYRVKFTLLTISVLLFFVSFAVSTFVGVDWYKSFWDNHERMLGLFTIFHFIVYYLAVTSIIKEWRDWKWLLRVFLLAGSIVMIIGGLQKINPQMLLNQGGERVSATLGNPIYFSGYGLFLFFVGLFLFLKEKEGLFFKYFAAVGGVLGFLGIFWGDTRGTTLGLGVGFFVLGISYLISLKQYPKVRKILGIITICGLLVLALIVVFRKMEFIQKLPGVGRLVNTDFSFTGSKVPRVMAWGIALDAWREKPVFGWGPNNFYYAFNKYYHPEFLESGWGETWFDNAHNIVMNTLAVQGTVGIVLYFGLFGAAVYSLWRAYRKQVADTHLVSIGTAFLAAHFVHNITVFENPTSYLYFFFFLAFINSQSSSKLTIQSVDKKIVQKSISAGLAVTIGLIVALLIYSTDINTAKANEGTLNVIRILYSNPSQAVDRYKEVANIPSPHIDDIRNDFSRTASQVIGSLVSKDQTSAQKLFVLAYEELKKNRQLHPLDIRIYIEQSQLALLGFQLQKDVKLLVEAESVLSEALSYSPKRQQVIYMLAPLKFQFGKKDEAFKLMRDSLTDDPLIEEGWWRLALMYRDDGKLAEAKKLVQEAESKGIKWSDNAKGYVAMIMATSTTNNLKIK